jgi:hypothetical protein
MTLEEARARIGELEKELTTLRSEHMSENDGWKVADDMKRMLEAAHARIQELEKPVEDEEVNEAIAYLVRCAPPAQERVAVPLLRRLSLQEKEGRAKALEEAAQICEQVNAGLVPPDGGSPTPREMLANVASEIRSLLPKG